MQVIIRRMNQRMFVRNGCLFTMYAQPVQADMLIKNGIIERIAPAIDQKEKMDVIDGRGMRILLCGTEIRWRSNPA